MPKPKPLKPFVFNDEAIENDRGFSILTSGIDLKRFSKNPVMLSDHWNSNFNVIGRWTDIKKENGLLTGLPEFDSEDEDVNRIAGKVERGFIKACSMGIIFDREDLKIIDDKIVLTKCELAEVSIVPIPSNANSIRLMNEKGEELKKEEIETLCLSIIDDSKNQNLEINMKKIVLSLAALIALGYDTKAIPNDGLEASDIESRVLELSNKLEAANKKNEALELAAKTAKEKLEAEAKERIGKKVDLAITQGKIAADKKQSFVELGISSETALDTALEAIPAKQNFSKGVSVPGASTTSEVKTMDDFEKLSHGEKLAFKENNPDAYNKLFN